MEQIEFGRCIACNRQHRNCTGRSRTLGSSRRGELNAGRGFGNGNQVVRTETVASMPNNSMGKRKVYKLRTAL